MPMLLEDLFLFGSANTGPSACDDGKWWLELPPPVPPPVLLNHSGTKLGSLFSILSIEHDNNSLQNIADHLSQTLRPLPHTISPSTKLTLHKANYPLNPNPPSFPF